MNPNHPASVPKIAIFILVFAFQLTLTGVLLTYFQSAMIIVLSFSFYLLAMYVALRSQRIEAAWALFGGGFLLTLGASAVPLALVLRLTGQPVYWIYLEQMFISIMTHFIPLIFQSVLPAILLTWAGWNHPSSKRIHWQNAMLLSIIVYVLLFAYCWRKVALWNTQTWNPNVTMDWLLRIDYQHD